MKNHHKVGNRTGRPTYRTPATFRYQKHLKNVSLNIIKVNKKIWEKIKTSKKQGS